MSRSGYSEDCEYINLYRATVDRAIGGKRGQAFLRELAAALDAMSEKRLIREQLVDDTGEVCAIGSVLKDRGEDMSKIYYDDAGSVADAVGIARCLAAEIEFINDDDFGFRHETPEARWQRVRKWVAENVKGVNP